MADYDAVIIGSGQGGTPLAITLAQRGKKVALIERAHVGGSCINFGCTPTKTMVASAHVAYLARQSATYGVFTGTVTVNMAKIRQRKREMVESFREGMLKRIQITDGLDLLHGEARFSGPKTVDVRLANGQSRRLTGDLIFINTGTRAAEPPLEGLDRVPVLHEESIMELDELPEHLLILGGGYLGLEFGQMFSRFGSPVTIIQRDEHLLTREDPDIASELARILRDEGLNVMLSTDARRVEQDAQGRIHLTVSGPDGEHALAGSHLLVAVGRTPNTDRLNLAAAGVETDDRGYIRVNDRLETSAPGVYALGDVKGGPAFTHISYDDFRIVRANVLDGGSATIQDRLVPYTVFTDPQLGRVGLSEQEARQRGYNIRVAKLPASRIARARETGQTQGMLKAVVDAVTGQILGCAVLSMEGGELMTTLQIAMMGRLPYTALRDGVFAHPTLAESLNNLFDSFES